MSKRHFIQFFVMLQLISTLHLYSQESNWYNKVSVFSGFVPSIAPTTGGTWGYPLGNASSIREQADYWHSKGGEYHAYFTFGNGWFDHSVRIKEYHACIDLDGNPIYSYSSGINIKTYTPNLHNPAWQDSLIKWVNQIIDTGADGVVIDGASPNVGTIYSDPAGSFDDYTMNDFKKYLENKYCASELGSKFDISNISDFHFGKWIKLNRLESTWNSWPLKGLSYEFLLFEWQFASKFHTKFNQSAKNYALSKYGKKFLIGDNGGSCAYYFVHQLDFQVDEFFYFDRPFLEYAASHTKLKKPLNNKPMIVLPEVADYNSKYHLMQNSQNMIKFILSDIYASGGTAVVYDQLWCPQHYQTPYYYNTDVLKQYTAFILNHPELYENLLTAPNVGLVYSYTSHFHNDWWHYPGSYRGMSKLLIDANIQHDAIFVSGPPLSDSLQIISENLSKYDCIILPSVQSMTNYQESQLRQYMSNGGTIIAVGKIYTKNENGEPVVNPEWQSLITEGAHTYGNGLFLYFSEDLGYTYTYDDHHQNIKIISDAINKHFRPETIIDAENPPSMFLYQKENSNKKIMHIVNYDYDPNSDSFTFKENFPVQVQADTTKEWEAVYVSPDFHGQRLLPTMIKDGYVNFTVPHLEAYGIVVLQENNFSPTIVSYSPKTDTLVVAGASIQFSVTVSDLDKNILFYNWHVNGKLDTLNTGNTYDYQVAISAAGTDTIYVEISDGHNKISKQWLVHIREYIRPKILFDESHDEKNTISLERAKIINFDHPDWVYYGIIRDKVSSFFTMDRNESHLLSSSYLSDYHVLILATPGSGFSSSEVRDILTFVSNGGGLFVILDAGINNQLRILLSNFGITQLDGVLFDPVSGGNLSITEFTDYNDIVHAKRFDMNWGGSLLLSDASTSVGQSSKQIWRDLNWNGLKENNEPRGPFTVMCATGYGKGKVYCISDNSFHDDFVKWEHSQNDELFLNIIKWLSSNVNQIPTKTDHLAEVAQTFSLYQNYPNPFNASTTISFQLPQTAKITIQIYNLLGHKIRTLANDLQPAGRHIISWDGCDDLGYRVSSGVYIVNMNTNGYSYNKKLIILR